MKFNRTVVKAGAVAGAIWLLWWLWNHPRRNTRETHIDANVLSDTFGLLIDDAGNVVPYPEIAPSIGLEKHCRCMNPDGTACC